MASNFVDNPWYRPIGEYVANRFTMVWYPHAGGGASPIIRASRIKPLDANLCVAMMPGRESRFNDPLSNSMEELIEALVANFPSTEESSQPSAGTVLVGHSFGSLLAFRVARELEKTDDPQKRLKGLVVMAMSAPARLGMQSKIAHLDDREFAVQLDKRFGGIPQALMDNKEAMQLFLPTVRHEIGMLESYNDDPQSKVRIPITALAGTDDEAASPTKMRDWALKTEAGFAIKMMPGDHFFPLARLHEIETIARQIANT